MTSIEKSSGVSESHRRTVEMLCAVLDGEPYESVAARQGVSRSAVERRVKGLALRLTQAVGVDGLQVSEAVFVNRLRLHRDAVLQALVQFDPTQLTSHREARVLTREEVELGARRVRVRSTRPLHDLPLYYLPFATGLRPLEVARLEVADYLQEDGSVRRESQVRPSVAINAHQRPLYFAHQRLNEALGTYFHERLRWGHGVGVEQRWRGLDPQSPIFLGEDGGPYRITTHEDSGQSRHVCRPLLETYRKIFRQADIPGISSQSARLTLMSRMYERGADEDQVGQVLGIADRSAVREQLPRPRPELAKVLEELA